MRSQIDGIMRLEKRSNASAAALVLAPVGAVAFTLLVSALLVLWAGAPVAATYGLLLKGGFGSVFALSETLTRAIPLLLTGLAATVAFKARLFNIGAEGQLYMGALAARGLGVASRFEFLRRRGGYRRGLRLLRDFLFVIIGCHLIQHH